MSSSEDVIFAGWYHLRQKGKCLVRSRSKCSNCKYNKDDTKCLKCHSEYISEYDTKNDSEKSINENIGKKSESKIEKTFEANRHAEKDVIYDKQFKPTGIYSNTICIEEIHIDQNDRYIKTEYACIGQNNEISRSTREDDFHESNDLNEIGLTKDYAHHQKSKCEYCGQACTIIKGTVNCLGCNSMKIPLSGVYGVQSDIEKFNILTSTCTENTTNHCVSNLDEIKYEPIISKMDSYEGRHDYYTHCTTSKNGLAQMDVQIPHIEQDDENDEVITKTYLDTGPIICKSSTSQIDFDRRYKNHHQPTEYGSKSCGKLYKGYKKVIKCESPEISICFQDREQLDDMINFNVSAHTEIPRDQNNSVSLGIKNVKNLEEFAPQMERKIRKIKSVENYSSWTDTEFKEKRSVIEQRLNSEGEKICEQGEHLHSNTCAQSSVQNNLLANDIYGNIENSNQIESGENPLNSKMYNNLSFVIDLTNIIKEEMYSEESQNTEISFPDVDDIVEPRQRDPILPLNLSTTSLNDHIDHSKIEKYNNTKSSNAIISQSDEVIIPDKFENVFTEKETYCENAHIEAQKMSDSSNLEYTRDNSVIFCDNYIQNQNSNTKIGIEMRTDIESVPISIPRACETMLNHKDTFNNDIETKNPLSPEINTTLGKTKCLPSDNLTDASVTILSDNSTDSSSATSYRRTVRSGLLEPSTASVTSSRRSSSSPSQSGPSRSTKTNSHHVRRRGRPCAQKLALDPEILENLDGGDRKRYMQRHKNNEASRESRRRRKAKEHLKELEKNELEKKNKKLKAKFETLEEIADNLKKHLFKNYIQLDTCIPFKPVLFSRPSKKKV